MLHDLSAANQETVYMEPVFGMNTTDKLAFWVEASQDGDKSLAWT